MMWHPPDTEQAWAECLSAYVDGELPPDAASALEAFLDAHPARARQVEALRETSRLLAEWQVPALAPDAGFAERLEAEATRGGRLARAFAGLRTLGRWPRTAAAFAAGLLVGVFATLGVQGGPDPAAGHVAVAPVPPGTMLVSQPAISPGQAEELLREVTAQGVALTLVEQIRSRDWTAALATYQDLVANYADTAVAGKLEGNGEVRLLKQAPPRALRRIDE
ncbi:MAG: hypothetical protein JXR94_23775 [Candidatus Hydrogenedentes bacterium]|nr:hypothetical protein [Candidatus Hydrogenedentota bacterium]